MKRIIVLLALWVTPVAAQMMPRPGDGDPRIQSVQYDPAQIIRLSVAPGLQTMVELAPGEAIQTVSVGDSAAWQVSVGKRGDIFFVKNVSATALTNMSVVTASRVYNIELMPAGGYGEVSPYHVKFTYPPKAPEAETASIAPAYDYRVSGAKAIRPSKVYQEGMRTIVEWPEAAALPGIFAMENGSESLVNGEMQDGRFIIAATPPKLIFRLDRKIAYATRRPKKADRP